MSFRKVFVMVAAVAALGVAAGAAFAQTSQQKAMIDAAKAAGTVGEQADGFVGFRVPSSDSALTAAVQATNAGRRQAYANSAAEGRWRGHRRRRRDPHVRNPAPPAHQLGPVVPQRPGPVGPALI
jgi:uncharacterized protein YdbL (DUF1318 family)